MSTYIYIRWSQFIQFLTLSELLSSIFLSSLIVSIPLVSIAVTAVQNHPKNAFIRQNYAIILFD